MTIRNRARTAKPNPLTPIPCPHAPIAQPDRAPDFESVGREFESPWARQKIKGLAYRVKGLGVEGSVAK